MTVLSERLGARDLVLNKKLPGKVFYGRVNLPDGLRFGNLSELFVALANLFE